VYLAELFPPFSPGQARQPLSPAFEVVKHKYPHDPPPRY
jgi:hypothetical protein